jgi:hypothetical protein
MPPLSDADFLALCGDFLTPEELQDAEDAVSVETIPVPHRTLSVDCNGFQMTNSEFLAPFLTVVTTSGAADCVLTRNLHFLSHITGVCCDSKYLDVITKFFAGTDVSVKLEDEQGEGSVCYFTEVGSPLYVKSRNCGMVFINMGPTVAGEKHFSKFTVETFRALKEKAKGRVLAHVCTTLNQAFRVVVVGGGSTPFPVLTQDVEGNGVRVRFTTNAAWDKIPVKVRRHMAAELGRISLAVCLWRKYVAILGTNSCMLPECQAAQGCSCRRRLRAFTTDVLRKTGFPCKLELEMVDCGPDIETIPDTSLTVGEVVLRGLNAIRESKQQDLRETKEFNFSPLNPVCKNYAEEAKECFDQSSPLPKTKSPDVRGIKIPPVLNLLITTTCAAFGGGPRRLVEATMDPAKPTPALGDIDLISMDPWKDHPFLRDKLPHLVTRGPNGGSTTTFRINVDDKNYDVDYVQWDQGSDRRADFDVNALLLCRTRRGRMRIKVREGATLSPLSKVLDNIWCRRARRGKGAALHLMPLREAKITAPQPFGPYTVYGRAGGPDCSRYLRHTIFE